jgi:hypothetical protein
MYVSFCGDRSAAQRLQNDWNLVGPCSTNMGQLCSSYFYAEQGLGCMEQGTIFSSGVLLPISCQVSGAASTPAIAVAMAAAAATGCGTGSISRLDHHAQKAVHESPVTRSVATSNTILSAHSSDCSVSNTSYGHGQLCSPRIVRMLIVHCDCALVC